MINLIDIVEKIDKVLNGKDTEIAISPSNDKYNFRCFSEGLYLSTISDNKGKNFIPVIIGSLGGNYNPIPNMEQADYSIQVQLFYPVRFKNDFYALNEFLVSTFVGKTLKYGNQYALSNISVAQYGELQNIDFNEFAKWINNTYAEKVNVMETYMSMSFTLYLSTAKNLNLTNGLLYGNEWKTEINIGNIYEKYKTNTYTEQDLPNTSTTLTFKGLGVNFIKVNNIKMVIGTTEYPISWSYVEVNGNDLYVDVDYEELPQTLEQIKITLYITYLSPQFTDAEPLFITQTDISNSEPIAQQVLGGQMTLGKAVQTSYTKELPLYVKNNSSYKSLIGKYLNRELQGLIVQVKEKCDVMSLENQRLYYITNFSFVKTKGQLMGISLTLAEDLENE